MSRWLVLAALAGCYAPASRVGSACDDVCPGNLECVDHVCVPPGTSPGHDAAILDATIDAMVDARMIDGPPGDVDADGVADNVDNCPGKANADQHSEDGDALGDVCDPCPHLSGNAADGDSDGVGDACDPQPGVAKQRIAFFDPFTSTRAEWELGSGASRVGETLRVNGLTSFGDSILNVATGELRIETGGTVASISSTTPHQLSIGFGFLDSTHQKYHYVELYNDAGTTGDIAISKANLGAYTGLATAQYPAPLPTGAWSMRIDESVAAQQIKLRAKAGGVQYNELTAATNTALPNLATSTQATLYVQHADVRFDYWIVIETLP
ncbi:MAG TPA: thrombospondin type 3 repeat-containing protein [Kofleriaceae bacterium]|nr:thrombospondin type 3 repeat-containing protein [Kofleriaceae bacterium]